MSRQKRWLTPVNCMIVQLLNVRALDLSGKNCALITEEYGSYVYLGELITNIPFEPDQPVEDGCGDCNICVDACPTGALVEGGPIERLSLYRVSNIDEKLST